MSRPSGAGPMDLIVTGTGDGMPFSKGLLAQSLLATAIEPAEAYAVAREIELALLASGKSAISREALRERAADTLRRRAGEEAARHYLLWRRYQEPDRPVVILLGGTSGVGKTTLAIEVARRLGIARVLSTDAIRQVMRILLSRELVPALFGSSYDAYRLLPPEGGRPPAVIDGFRAQARAVSVGIRAALDRAVDESASVVMDGVSIAPGILDLEAWQGRADVIFLIVAVRDEDLLRSHFVARAEGQKRRLPHRYLENFEGVLAIQRHLLEQAEREGIPVVDNALLDDSVRQVIHHVMKRLSGSESGLLPR